MGSIIKILCIVLLTFSVTQCHAQLGKLDKANRLYEQLAFQSAIPIYEQILSKVENIEAALKLADCYRLTNKSLEAEYWYNEVVSSEQATPIQKLYLAQALMNNEKYDTALQWFEAYALEMPSDERGLNGITSCEVRSRIAADAFPCRIVNLSINSSKAEFGPSFYDDGILFVSDRDSTLGLNRSHLWTGNPFLNIYHSKTGAQGRLRKPRKLLTPINGNFHEGPLTMDSTLNEMFFTRSNYSNHRFVRKVKKSSEGLVKLKIFHAVRSASKGWDYDEEKEFAFNNDEYSVGHPALSKDGSILIFASDMPGGHGGVDLYITERQADASWSIPENLGPEINTPGHDMFPFLHQDGSLYFASDGLPGIGGLDIFYAQPEALLGKRWSNPRNMGAPLNSAKDDFGLIISKELESGYFVSDRKGGHGGDDIYAFEAEPPRLLINAFDELSGEPLEAVDIELNTNAHLIETSISDLEGNSNFEIERKLNYVVIGTKAEYSPTKVEVPKSTSWLPSMIKIDLPMRPIGQLVLIGRVIQLPSRSPLPDATVFMRDQCLIKDRTIVTDAEGLFKIPVSSECIYNFNAKHKDYIDARKEVSTKGVEPPGEISVLLELGKVPSEPILLSNIYYDLDKFYIRRDAAPDLEKLAVIMNRYSDMEIELSSHTDSRATDEYNLNLSQNRAEAALEYLVNRGIQHDRMIAKGYGEKQLRNNCADGVNCSERDHQRNRRTEFRILNFGQDIRSTEKSFIPVNTGQVAGPVSKSQLAQIEKELREVDLTKEALDRPSNSSENRTDPVVSSSQNKQQNQTDQGEEVWFQSGVAYSVHLGSGSLNDASRFNKYRRYGAVQYEPWEGQYLYVLGYFTDKTEAAQVLKEVVSGGLSDAYLVIYKNGVRTN